MEPLNQRTRTSFIGRFVGVYAFSLVFPILGVWMLLRVPGSVSDSERDRYRQIVETQRPLVVDTDTMGSLVKQLIRYDGAYSSSSDAMARAEAQTQLVSLENRINNLMAHIKAVDIRADDEHNKALSAGIASLSEGLVTYRQTIAELRRTLAEKGIDMQMVNDLRNQVNMKDLEIRGLERQVAAAPRGGGGGGGGGADPTARELQAKLNIAQRNLDDCLKKGGGNSAGPDPAALAQLRSKLQECEKALDEKINYTEWERYAEGVGYLQLIKKGDLRKNEKQGYYDQAKQIFDGLQLSTANSEMRTKATARMGELRKLGL
ncbi:hypothetical protein [Persicitalea jodogahamensis]|uniref:Uncharacterized protein n=1 Tax=Persicitalea jodogahamensis TaxID=402147 RepID=A0A8J3G7B5_9BACT|nr:hypothetical protein [Persicitalea jodogahamensis]GHB52032.1 hypothetical protein GCM10007390_00800 [Persicitalea jodogahamensis]